MVLTAREVTGARPKEKAYKISDGRGLYLYVSPYGLRSWRANYTEAGKQKTRTYGSFPAMTLADARAAHSRARAAPAKDSATFQDAALSWLEIKLPTLSNSKHQVQVANTLERHVFPAIGHLPLNAITRLQLVGVVKGLQHIPETASRVAQRIAMVFNYAQDAGLIEANPSAGLTRVLPRKTVTHQPCIAPADAPALMRAIDGYTEPVTRLALLMAAHVFTRDSELRGMRFSEVKKDERLWVIPANRMKLRKPHVVPLTDTTMALIAEAEKYSACDFVFESALKPGHSIGENTLLFALYRLGYKGRMTVHGFRSLASTVLNEQGFPGDVVERQLAHKERDDVRAAYNRAEYLDQRRAMMTWWSDWLDRCVSAPQSNT